MHAQVQTIASSCPRTTQPAAEKEAANASLVADLSGERRTSVERLSLTPAWPCHGPTVLSPSTPPPAASVILVLTTSLHVVTMAASVPASAALRPLTTPVSAMPRLPPCPPVPVAKAFRSCICHSLARNASNKENCTAVNGRFARGQRCAPDQQLPRGAPRFRPAAAAACRYAPMNKLPQPIPLCQLSRCALGLPLPPVVMTMYDASSAAADASASRSALVGR